MRATDVVTQTILHKGKHMDFRKIVFTLGFLTMLVLAGGLGYVNNHLMKLRDAKDLEIAGLHLKIAEMEGVIVGPQLVEAAINDKGDVMVRINENDAFIYGFPGLCRNPGYNGNL